MLAATLSMVAMQAGPALQEPEPPDVSLQRSYEMFSTVLCRAPDRRSRMETIERRYAARWRALRAEIAKEFGNAAAERGYVSVGPCLVYTSRADLERRLSHVGKAFEAELAGWEDRYGLPHGRKE